MKILMKTLLLTAFAALTYPALAADPAPQTRPGRVDISRADYMKQAETRFDAMDTNKDGKLSAEERAAARPGRGAGPGARFTAEVTKEQFLKYHEQRFAAMDANKDGKLTWQERRAARRAFMQKNCDQSASGPQGRGPRCGHRGPRASAPAAR